MNSVPTSHNDTLPFALDKQPHKQVIQKRFWLEQSWKRDTCSTTLPRMEARNGDLVG